ncbi:MULTISPECIES: nuclear transport factor 2 family protein [Pararhizobium]|jgi:ketosteroid isomerase-like protein|uniref:nuclear transport factor 2 family protein n=1 Tax=Pararhizobium TaxID=1612611 RepID=UPI0023E1970A|nr:nuclear transport factor 2 family protein [Pararhizobium qamdonense]
MTLNAFDPAAAAERFHAAIGDLDFDTIENFFADDATYSSGKVGGLEGRADIMAAFRRYFAEYPDQVAEDSLIVKISPLAARAVWSLQATSSSTGTPLVRRGEETITFNDQGKIISVDVTDF